MRVKVGLTNNVYRKVAINSYDDQVTAHVDMYDPSRNKRMKYHGCHSPFDANLPAKWWTFATADRLQRVLDTNHFIWRLTYHTHLPEPQKKTVYKIFDTTSDVEDALENWGIHNMHLIKTCDCDNV